MKINNTHCTSWSLIPTVLGVVLPLSYVSITVAIDEDPSRTVQAAILEVHLTPPISEAECVQLSIVESFLDHS